MTFHFFLVEKSINAFVFIKNGRKFFCLCRALGHDGGGVTVAPTATATAEGKE